MPGDVPDGPVPEPVLIAQQEFSGLDIEQAQSEDFQEAVEQAVADQLDIDPALVTVTSATVDEEGDVVVVYVVQNPPEDAEVTYEHMTHDTPLDTSSLFFHALCCFMLSYAFLLTHSLLYSLNCHLLTVHRRTLSLEIWLRQSEVRCKT